MPLKKPVLIFLLILTGLSMSCSSFDWDISLLFFGDESSELEQSKPKPHTMIRRDSRGRILTKITWIYSQKGEIIKELVHDREDEILITKTKQVLEDGTVEWTHQWKAGGVVKKTITLDGGGQVLIQYQVQESQGQPFQPGPKEILFLLSPTQGRLEFYAPDGEQLGQTVFQYTESGSLRRTQIQSSLGELIQELESNYDMGTGILLSTQRFGAMGEVISTTRFTYENQLLTKVAEYNPSEEILSMIEKTYNELGLLVEEAFLDEEGRVFETREYLYEEEVVR